YRIWSPRIGFANSLSVDPHPLGAASVVIVSCDGIYINCAGMFALSFAIHQFISWIVLMLSDGPVHQTIEKLGIQIQIIHLLGVKNEIADALNRQYRAGDNKLKENIFQQTCLQMNLNLTIELFSQHFNNLLPRFMSTIRGHGETAIDALNQTWKKELPWIHPPIPLLPAVLKKI
ncbi:MAG: hypothetical protein EZS28_036444, partial [Streblomastix strix]